MSNPILGLILQSQKRALVAQHAEPYILHLHPTLVDSYLAAAPSDERWLFYGTHKICGMMLKLSPEEDEGFISTANGAIITLRFGS